MITPPSILHAVNLAPDAALADLNLDEAGWLTAHDIRSAADCFRVRCDAIEQDASLAPEARIMATLDVYAIRAAVRAYVRKSGTVPKVPQELTLDDDLARVTRGTTLSALHGLGAHTVRDLLDLALSPTEPLPGVAPQVLRRVRAVAEAVERRAAWMLWRDSLEARKDQMIANTLADIDDPQRPIVLFGLSLVEQGIGTTMMHADGRGLQFIFKRPQDKMGRALMAWVQARPEGCGEC